MPEDFSSNLASNTTETPTVNRRRRRKRGQEDNNGQGNSNENNGVNKEPISQLEENLLKLGTTISAPVCTFIFYGYQRSVIHLTFYLHGDNTYFGIPCCAIFVQCYLNSYFFVDI